MTCAVITPDAMASAVSVGQPRQAISGPSPCAPAVSIAPGPNSDGKMRSIASRCKRLRHSNNEQRKRYLAVHRALATYSAGDA